MAEFRIAQAVRIYEWEVVGDQQIELPSRLWAGSVFDAATAQGMTQACLVTWATSDSDFRRKLARYVGRHLAASARVNNAGAAGEDLMRLLSCEIRNLIQRIVDGAEISPGFACFVQLHRNLS